MMTAHKRTVSRGHKKRERTRALLIRAGVSVLAKKGEALTISDVVEEAEVSSGTFYNYFRDRQELLEALATHALSTLDADATSSSTGKDPAKNFALLTSTILSRASDDPTVAKAVLRLTDHKQSFERAMTKTVAKQLSEGFDRGRFRFEPDAVTLDLVIGFLTASIRRIANGEAEPAYVGRVVERSLLALGVAKQEASKLASAAVANPPR